MYKKLEDAPLTREDALRTSMRTPCAIMNVESGSEETEREGANAKRHVESAISSEPSESGEVASSVLCRIRFTSLCWWSGWEFVSWITPWWSPSVQRNHFVPWNGCLAHRTNLSQWLRFQPLMKAWPAKEVSTKRDNGIFCCVKTYVTFKGSTFGIRTAARTRILPIVTRLAWILIRSTSVKYITWMATTGHYFMESKRWMYQNGLQATMTCDKYDLSKEWNSSVGTLILWYFEDQVVFFFQSKLSEREKYQSIKNVQLSKHTQWSDDRMSESGQKTVDWNQLWFVFSVTISSSLSLSLSWCFSFPPFVSVLFREREREREERNERERVSCFLVSIFSLKKLLHTLITEVLSLALNTSQFIPLSLSYLLPLSLSLCVCVCVFLSFYCFFFISVFPHSQNVSIRFIDEAIPITQLLGIWQSYLNDREREREREKGERSVTEREREESVSCHRKLCFHIRFHSINFFPLSSFFFFLSLLLFLSFFLSSFSFSLFIFFLSLFSFLFFFYSSNQRKRNSWEESICNYDLHDPVPRQTETTLFLPLSFIHLKRLTGNEMA